MAFDFLDKICDVFCNKSRAEGYDDAVRTAFPLSDVLIWSDTDHTQSSSMIADLLSEEKIQDLAAQGVTDIYLENIELAQPLVTELIADGDIDKFVAQYDSIASSLHLPQNEFLAKTRDTAHAILAAAKQTPPIDIHFVQISYTEEQLDQINEAEMRIIDIEDETIQTIKGIRGQITEHIERNESDPQLVSAAETLQNTLATHMLQRIRNGTEQFDYNALETQFRGQIPDEILDAAVTSLSDLDTRHAEASAHKDTLAVQFRVDNDVMLVDRITETKNEEGHAVIFHGAVHGAYRDGTNGVDLDELLLQDGLTSTRINVVYNTEYLRALQDALPDTSDMSYFPKEGRFVVDSIDETSEVKGFEGVSPVPVVINP